MTTNSNLLAAVCKLAREAGQKIAALYNSPDQITVEHKQDGSPVTAADQVSNDYIVSGLLALTPEWPVLSEESADIPYADRANWERFWLVDPLDGTQEFLQRTGEFTVNIALIERHQPILGVVYVPMSSITYYAQQGLGAYKNGQPIHVQPCSDGPVRVIASRRHAVNVLAPILERLDSYEITHAGSSLKFCRIAEGLADLYPRLGLTSEWDTAAAQCIVEVAGGYVLDAHGLPLRYNTGDSMLNPHFVVISSRDNNWIEKIFNNEK